MEFLSSLAVNFRPPHPFPFPQLTSTMQDVPQFRIKALHEANKSKAGGSYEQYEDEFKQIHIYISRDKISILKDLEAADVKEMALQSADYIPVPLADTFHALLFQLGEPPHPPAN